MSSSCSAAASHRSRRKLSALYPDHEAYVSAIATSAQDLMAKRYILPEDAEAYIDAAKRSDIGRP